MTSHSFPVICVLWSILTTCLCSIHVQKHAHQEHSRTAQKRAVSTDNDPEHYFHFVTRPDIGAVKWDITIYDEAALAPGYWFLAPYASLDQTTFPLWNGPHIYDGKGELIWSGAPMFKHANTHDFQPAQIDGEQMLSLIFPHDHPGAKVSITGMNFPPGQNGSGVIIDNSYNIHETVYMRGNLDRQNMHDLTMRDNGKRALMLTAKPDKEIPLHIDGFNGTCKVGWQGFKEVDVETGETIFEWFAQGHIGEHESTKKEDTWENICKDEWDLLHFNAVDKFQDGDYLVSARHTNTVYKVSHKDGSIVWRLGGLRNDFEFRNERATFTRQHHTKIYGENETHTLISIFANNMGTGDRASEKPSQDSSLGLLLALRTDVHPMTVDLVSVYERPNGGFSPSRGSVTFLPNGNAFVGWTIGSLQSEHAFDGRILMSASLNNDRANSYRSYKRPWVGRPSQPPDVHSVAMKNGRTGVTTLVHVSWNGATEVATWNLLHTDHAGNVTELLASAARQGFETALSWNSFAKYIVVVALDVNGEEIGRSKVTETSRPTDFDESLAVAEEAQWLQTLTSSSETHAGLHESWAYAIVAFLLGVLFCFVAGCVAICVVRNARARSGQKGTYRWLSRLPAYRAVAEGSEEDMEQREFMLSDKEVIEAEKSPT